MVTCTQAGPVPTPSEARTLVSCHAAVLLVLSSHLERHADPPNEDASEPFDLEDAEVDRLINVVRPHFGWVNRRRLLSHVAQRRKLYGLFAREDDDEGDDEDDDDDDDDDDEDDSDDGDAVAVAEDEDKDEDKDEEKEKEKEKEKDGHENEENAEHSEDPKHEISVSCHWHASTRTMAQPSRRDVLATSRSLPTRLARTRATKKADEDDDDTERGRDRDRGTGAVERLSNDRKAEEAVHDNGKGEEDDGEDNDGDEALAEEVNGGEYAKYERGRRSGAGGTTRKRRMRMRMRRDRESTPAAHPLLLPETRPPPPWTPRQQLICLPDDIMETTRVDTDSKSDAKFYDMMDLLRQFRDERGHCRVPDGLRYEKGSKYCELSKWVMELRRTYKKMQTSGLDSAAQLTPERISALTALGFEFRIVDPSTVYSWEERLEQCRRYREEHGHLNIPVSHHLLGQWCSRMRTQHKINREGNDHSKSVRGGKVRLRSFLTPERERQLDELDFVWQVRKRRRASNDGPKPFDVRFRELLAFKEKHGHLRVTKALDEELYGWVCYQRRDYRLMLEGKKHRMTADALKKLNEIRFVFCTGRTKKIGSEENVSGADDGEEGGQKESNMVFVDNRGMDKRLDSKVQVFGESGEHSYERTGVGP